MFELIHGDCLAALRGMPSASVDLVVTDPPYGQSNEDYDSDIAFRPDVWRECLRVARPGAALVSFAGSPTYHRIASAIEAGGWKVRQMWGWVYRDGMITSAWPKEGFDRLAPAMDPICYATKDKVILSLDREGGETWERPACPSSQSSRSRGKAARYGGNGHWPRSIVASDGIEGFQYFILSRTHGHRGDGMTGHPNQKPLAILHWIISKLPGLVILDPFAGSGTTGVAALEEGREFVGIDRHADYVAMARRRLEAA